MARHCTPENIKDLISGIDEIIDWIDSIGTQTNKNIGANINRIYKELSDSGAILCLTELGLENEDAEMLSTQLQPIGQRLMNGVTGPAKKIRSNLINFLEYIENVDLEEHEDDEDEEDEEDEKDEDDDIFPEHKYLHIANKDEFPDIKSKYKELSLMYHPDKCPNENTPNMTKTQCEEEFKKLNNEYSQIKEHFEIIGGRKRNKLTKFRTSKKSKKSRKSKRYIKSKKNLKKTRRPRKIRKTNKTKRN